MAADGLRLKQSGLPGKLFAFVKGRSGQATMWVG